MLVGWRRYTRGRLCRTGTDRWSDIIPKQINGRLLPTYRSRLARSRHSLRRRTFDLRLFLYNRKRLVGQSRPSKQTGIHTTSSSRVDGSGIPPSIIHRLESYLVRMKFSIFLLRSPLTTIPHTPTASLTLPRGHGRVQVSPPNTCRSPLATRHNSNQWLDKLVGPRITPFQHALELFIGPRVEIHRFDPTDMSAHAPVNTRAANANEDADVPGSPSRI